MNINVENINKVKSAFENLAEYGKVRIDSEHPFYNAYDYNGEIIFSMPHKSYNQASEYADQEYFKEFFDKRNDFRSRVRWIGILNTSRFFLEK